MDASGSDDASLIVSTHSSPSLRLTNPNATTDVALPHILAESDWTLKGHITPLRADRYGAAHLQEHARRQRKNAWSALIHPTVDEFTEFVCVCRRCQERQTGERDGERETAWHGKRENLVVQSMRRLTNQVHLHIAAY